MDEPTPVERVEVVVYWRPGCLFCWALRRRLRAAGVTVRERNIWDDPAAAAFVRSAARGYETVPTVEVAGSVLVNPAVGEVLARLGRPVELRRRSSWRARLERILGGRGAAVREARRTREQ